MLTIIIGTIIVLVTMERVRRRKNFSQFGTGVVGVLMILAVIVTAVFIPLSGYDDWTLVEEVQLVPFHSDDTSENETKVYARLSEYNVYTYCYRVNEEDVGKTLRLYKEGTAKKEESEKIEDPECENPVVRKYNRKGKKTVWTFGGFAEQRKTIFYVPPGTILEYNQLN